MPSSDEPRSRRPLVDGGAARGGAQQELPTGGGGGATGDTGDRRGTGAAARAGPQLPALAPRCRSRRTLPRHGPGTARRTTAPTCAPRCVRSSGIRAASVLPAAAVPVGSIPTGVPDGPGGARGLWLTPTSSGAAALLSCAGAVGCAVLGASATGRVLGAQPPPRSTAKGFCHTFLHKIYTTIYLVIKSDLQGPCPRVMEWCRLGGRRCRRLLGRGAGAVCLPHHACRAT